MESPSTGFRRLRHGAPGVMGLVIAALGCGQVFYIYAFASMVDPRLAGAAYWNEVLGKVFLSAAAIPTVLGLIMVVAGIVAVTMEAIGGTARGLPMRIRRAAVVVGLAAAVVSDVAMLGLG